MLKITNLSVKKDKKLILNKVSLSLRPGQVHVLMGPNGSGKSTLAHAIIGDPRVKTSGGTIMLDKEDISTLLPDERSKKGLFLSFQTPIEIPGLRFAEFLRHAHNSITGEIIDVGTFREELIKKAEHIGLNTDLINREVNANISGGEKKKMELLQMMMLKPKYIVVDEIDSGLDIDAVKIVAKELNQLVKDGASLLIITHYKRILGHLKPNKVSILTDGKITAKGSIELINNIEKLGYDPIKNRE